MPPPFRSFWSSPWRKSQVRWASWVSQVAHGGPVWELGRLGELVSKDGLKPALLCLCVLVLSQISTAPMEARFYSAFEGGPHAQPPLALPAGVRFGPPGSRRLVYFVDDMNSE